ncbi:response regulator transcription factor [Bradyrhizobium sp. DASA03120]|uniref:response regulator transcription factor n=1 Tax=Bradyrhizobium sp. SMVTL-02 TaxID=3395917 RepID=UPI003F728371
MRPVKPSPGIEQTVYALDVDLKFRTALSAALAAAGRRLVAFGDGPTLIATARRRMPLCILINVEQTDQTALGVLAAFQREAYPAPIFAISGRADIPTAVTALRLGALEFFDKLRQFPELLARIDDVARTIETRDSRLLTQAAEGVQFRGREQLSSREIEVLGLLAAGRSSKQVAKRLGISHRTVHDHRYRIMRKLEVRNITDLVRLVHGSPTVSSPDP